MSALKSTLISDNWAVCAQCLLQAPKSIGQKIRKNTIFTLMRKGCMSCCFQANSQSKKHSEGTVAMGRSHGSEKNLQAE